MKSVVTGNACAEVLGKTLLPFADYMGLDVGFEKPQSSLMTTWPSNLFGSSICLEPISFQRTLGIKSYKVSRSEVGQSLTVS